MKKILGIMFMSIFWISFSQASMVEHRTVPLVEKNLSLESGIFLAESIFSVNKPSIFDKIKDKASDLNPVNYFKNGRKR
jgi:hypothetical protein